MSHSSKPNQISALSSSKWRRKRLDECLHRPVPNCPTEAVGEGAHGRSHGNDRWPRGGALLMRLPSRDSHQSRVPMASLQVHPQRHVAQCTIGHAQQCHVSILRDLFVLPHPCLTGCLKPHASSICSKTGVVIPVCSPLHLIVSQCEPSENQAHGFGCNWSCDVSLMWVLTEWCADLQLDCCDNDNDNDHSFSQLPVHKALTCSQGQSAGAVLPRPSWPRKFAQCTKPLIKVLAQISCRLK